MKKLRVTFSNGECYDIPLDVIAKNRAEYYVKLDTLGGDDCLQEYEKEFKIGIEHSQFSVDWAFNNMDWSDLEKHAVLVENDNLINKEEEWINVDWEVIE